MHDPISRYLGPVPPDKAAITVQQLLTHTAGLVDALGGDYEPLTRRQLVADALASPLRSPPGSAYHYSNVGYSLLAAIVQEASGMGYERFLARHLFAPAGMTQTGLRAAALAAGRRRGGVRRPRPRAGPAVRPPVGGERAVVEPARQRRHALDRPRPGQVAPRAPARRPCLDRRAQRELFRPRVREEPGGDSRYGYGWVLLDTVLGRVAWHNGGNGWSYGELARVLGTGTMVFWVTNRSRSDAAGWHIDRLGLTAGVLLRLAGRL